jgi:hypothetical protein
VDQLTELFAVLLVGLATTSSSMVGAAIGLYAPLSRRVLACILAFAAGSLLSALAIELVFKGAKELHHLGFNADSAWEFIAGGFACGAIVYYATSLLLERKGAAVWHPAQFEEYALARKHEQARELIGLLAQCDLLRHLFLGGIPEAAASAAMLTRAGYTAKSILGLWATVLVAGMTAAVGERPSSDRPNPSPACSVKPSPAGPYWRSSRT